MPATPRLLIALSVALSLGPAGGCATTQPVADSAAARPATAGEASRFVADAEKQLTEFAEYARRVGWVRSNFITDDTNWLARRAHTESTKLSVRLAKEARRFNGLKLPAEVARKLKLLKLEMTLPAPDRDGAAQRLAELTNRLSTTYSTGTIELDGRTVPLDEIQELMATVKDPAKLQEIWTKWRHVSPPMAKDYAEMVSIANDGAVELGFQDLGRMWLSKYDMEPEAMAAEVERLWQQVKPLYDQLHCYVRGRLNQTHGDTVVPLDKPIRADLLGNMWAQQWGTIYPLVAPPNADVGYDLTKLLRAKSYTPEKMVRAADTFFQSLGIAALPDTFWKRSLIEKPRDRNVVCHASAWTIDAQDDIRIKMCTKVTAEDFQVVHHELGHNIYQRAYKDKTYLYQEGAHDGFHEAVGDFIALSITPSYLVDIGLLDPKAMPAADKDLGLLMQAALDKIAFLPFGLLMDKWRWQVFSGEVPPERYNEAWWELRTRYQGIRPPSARPADAFDPGAKFHIPGNTPYLRYFLAFVMQFQFHEAACRMSGWKGDLHRCSIFGSTEVGKRFHDMLAMGISRPWPEVLEVFTGTRKMDAKAIIFYFQPLIAWLEKQNAGKSCGWSLAGRFQATVSGMKPKPGARGSDML